MASAPTQFLEAFGWMVWMSLTEQAICWYIEIVRFLLGLGMLSPFKIS